jgi:hypothetical protein
MNSFNASHPVDDDNMTMASDVTTNSIVRRSGPGRKSNAEKAAEEAAKAAAKAAAEKIENEEAAKKKAYDYLNECQTLFLNGITQDAIGQKVFDDNFSIAKMEEYELGMRLLVEEGVEDHKNTSCSSFVMTKVIIYRFNFQSFHVIYFSSDPLASSWPSHPHI